MRSSFFLKMVRQSRRRDTQLGLNLDYDHPGWAASSARKIRKRGSAPSAANISAYVAVLSVKRGQEPRALSGRLHTGRMVNSFVLKS
jgi:hypothetical protein